MESIKLREVAVQVCHYFKDFLESDFKKHQAPRRRIVLQTDEGFRCGMRLRQYPTLEHELWAQLGKPSGDPLTLKIVPRRHTRALSPVLRTVVDEHVQAIEPASVAQVRQAVLDHVTKTYSKSIKDPENWIDGVCTHLREKVGVLLVRPLITRLDAAIQRGAYSVVDSLFSAESEMIEVISASAAAALPAVLAKYMVQQDSVLIDGALSTFLSDEAPKSALGGFFEGFVTSDAFLEFRDIDTYASITEGVQMYLYIGSCRFRNAQYPLLFVPVQVEKSEDGQGYQLTLINQLFANRAAIDFVLQELAAAKMREWASPIQDRINYLTPEQSIYEVARSLFSLVVASMDLAGKIEFSSRAPEAATADVALSTALHLCVFERGEEALVNDYEELIALARQGGAPILDLFEKMVRGILEENPKSIAAEVNDEWESLPLVDRMVFDSPIPLNEEQRKILLAVRKQEGWITVVEGPPGTGKSHAITAIAADCAFNKKSCLVLSDKTEALQVVQNKLSDAMNRVRHVDDFPNPLLRIGRQDANFKRLVANQTVNQVGAYVRAVRANQGMLDAERKETSESMKKAIDATVGSLGAIELERLRSFHACEAKLHGRQPELVEALGSLGADDVDTHALARAAKSSKDLEAYLGPVLKEGGHTFQRLRDRIYADLVTSQFTETLAPSNLVAMKLFQSLDAPQSRELSSILLVFRQLKMPIFGYLFRGSAVRELEMRLSQLPVSQVLQIKPHIEALDCAAQCANVLFQKLDAVKLGAWVAHAWRLAVAGAPEVLGPQAALSMIEAISNHEAVESLLVSATAGEWSLAATHLHNSIELRTLFERAPEFDYVGAKTKLERLNTSMMNSHVDTRLVDYMENHRADAKVLSSLLAQRQKFPEEKFDAVRNSFPIIIASIREFGEYMPLAPELFDVVVIDEASQVSVAQALPALLRARKVVVLGDSKQFSNVKSSNASIATNDKYRSALVQFFEAHVSKQAEKLRRLSMFNVKCSVLEFCSLAASYSIMLRKHFRSYPELISYSSNTFYDHQLQAIKVRGVPLSDVIRFDLVDASAKPATRSTNHAEADFIEAQLLDLLESGEYPTVGVITPFREQHTLLTKRLHGHARAAEFESKLRLKIMTFDTCQGEERQIIFYSIVASPGNDALNYIFPTNLEGARDSVEDKLKMQRLNVGFSRSQEMIWFVHSMPLENFKGSIAHALNHYARVLQQKHGDEKQIDPNSPMEARVLGWLQSTPFVQEFGDDVEILPQFPIGDYLKQLDPLYEHPSWRVDFLMTVQATKPVHIVIEYDGFEFHFQKNADVHIGNHQRYLNPQDVERQLTLESYGYRFLRINRFNMGKDPVDTLDKRLRRLVEIATGEPIVKTVEHLQMQAEGMANKDMKQCTRCDEIKALAGFFDQALKGGAGGYGRVCTSCKGADKRPQMKLVSSRPSAYRRRRWA
jgi:hypothetical protein